MVVDLEITNFGDGLWALINVLACFLRDQEKAMVVLDGWWRTLIFTWVSPALL